MSHNLIICSLKNESLWFCLQELSDEIEEYTQRFNTEDQLEWNLVLQEVAAFVEVISFLKCHIKNDNIYMFIDILGVTIVC